MRDDVQRFISSLKRTMNVSNLKHLEIPLCAANKTTHSFIRASQRSTTFVIPQYFQLCGRYIKN